MRGDGHGERTEGLRVRAATHQVSCGYIGKKSGYAGK